MNVTKGSGRKSIFESPFYWIYVFSTAGLIGLVLLGPKFLERQVQEERSFQGRERVKQAVAGHVPSTEMSTIENSWFRLQPLAWVLSVVLIGSWFVVWWQFFRRRRKNC